MNMTSAFSGLVKIEKRSAGEVVRLGKVKFPFRPETKPDDPVSKLIEELVAQNLLMDALKMLALALPPREGVWWGCLAARDMLEPDQKTKALTAAEAWVFKPSQETKKALEPFSLDTDLPDTMMCEAAFNVPLPDDREAPTGPPHLPGLLIFSAQLQSFYAPDLPEEINRQGQLLLGRGLDISKGGNGQVGEESSSKMGEGVG